MNRNAEPSTVTKKTFKFTVAVFILLLLSTTSLFAEGTITVLDDAGNKILSLISATWVKALLAIALVIEFGVIAFGNSQGEGGMIKKMLPWIVGTGGILGAVSIVKFFFSNIQPDSF